MTNIWDLIRRTSKRRRERRIGEAFIAASVGAAGMFLLHRAFSRLPRDERQEIILGAVPALREFVASILSPEPQEYVFGCNDCHEYGLGYMLRDEIWEQVLTPEELEKHPHDEPSDPMDPMLLCMTCAAKRLGRNLRAADLSDVPLNRSVLYAYSREGEAP